jgi:hypothetical protein
MVRVTLLVLGLLVAFQPWPTNAQSLPNGSYRNTCGQCRIHEGALVCFCKNRKGQAQPTFLFPAFCRGNSEVVNNGGNLECGRSTGGLPPGSYKMTCRNCSVAGTKLKCQCQRRNGSWNNTGGWNFSGCRSVGNNDGRLYCER